ncbi:hypothetical protein A3J90_04815 [candidate division WOR-1 bacterium RIFOXYC2_FULL_37_10]|uniref:Uncharacterized protein n=1 Tax=candidate division WOR-1 bacterium RIFOXYB2_FULL_37_13 TaxID=1802579 RepID=A0A1F4SVQ3_UNCSA|nr:MAG: hypothetical protein A2246_06335 [candidate division WOR-1 bacterium RIFOXYA2_FULL_37_7]OGC24447.1 MAG: hypothetical protein A2310_08585 [candidate division WOR-1 bacterium RIFOXYB2_FULL_37_13]OGC35545.1 MAG: hypothetical protein A3J90_04815 [candidate division WOR-1 bacterium RIFOXYC2_FULL_37_10]
MNNNHLKLKCSVCEHEIEIPSDTQVGARVTCPNCFAQLHLGIEKGKRKLRCALCLIPDKECRTFDCERRMSEREKRGFFDVRL